ncbi:glycoside hydrolase family 31 protein [Silvimonas iriomotensis]|uniref:Alpha-glucosidase n=1 Tax=Silvimonas iriomotensis TaxID=449662 RepID=A0ABQ2PAM5_9NEIS|nr:glycoside hydrolase family 31 protein [Silvimonas iriomotensis]GGP21714.1 alpha-glucosidase [Silvimonas iriomotensis]
MAITVSSQLYDTSGRVAPVFSLAQQDAHMLRFEAAAGHAVQIEVLEEDLIRVQVIPAGTQARTRSWCIAPGMADVPLHGHDAAALPGFARPSYQLVTEPQRAVISTAALRLEIDLNGFYCSWFMPREDAWIKVASDRPTQGYNFGYWDERVYHYLARAEEEQYFGLGEKTGEANRHGNSYRMCNLDAAFYNAKSTDPLYKHIPFYITRHAINQTTFGLYYDTPADCRFDFGREHDNYHGFYRSFVAETGPLDYYFIAGGTVREVVRRFTWLTGTPAFPPRWSLGYSGSTMSYTDAPDAQARMDEFLDNCSTHDILCDSFHLSSGYTTIAGKRYVFNWDTAKFPDAKGFTRRYLDHGVHLVANIKPALLKTHPRFAEAAQAGALINNPDGTPLPVAFWGGDAAYVDFTAEAGYNWWKNGVKTALLDYGISSAWNDNNEFEIWDTRALAANFGQPVPAIQIKPLQTLLMCKASFEAQQEHAPTLRPFTVSRAGCAGMQRYVQTWSGDNYTSWQTLKYNVRMGTGLAMSGVSNTGHDIGGFLGPQPDAELFLRWVQFGIFLPRFSIHSENSGEVVTEPWMYPEITPQIRDLIKLRYRLLPCYYDLLYRSHTAFEPVMRPTYYTFPHDARCYAENDDMMIGDNLLIAAVVEQGARTRDVYLPAGSNWLHYSTGQRLAGGQTVTLPAELGAGPILLVREGSGIALNVAEQHFAHAADARGFLLCPPMQGQFAARCFEDDGLSFGYQDSAWGEWRIDVTASTGSLAIAIDFSGDPRFAQSTLQLLLPASETRKVTLTGATCVVDAVAGLWRVLDVTRA